MDNKANKNPLAPIANFFTRFNLVIFIVVSVGGLIAAILMINNILRLPYESSSTNNNNAGSVTFDETTVIRLNKLMTSDQNSADQALPTGRINPFN